MKMSSVKKVSFRRAILPASIVAALALSGSASAFKIETDNPDLDVRFDNTFRYNAGWRMQDPSADLAAPTSGIFATERKFKEKGLNGGMVTNRLDILTELDFIYKKDTGFRVSAASWYDRRYGNTQQPGNGNFVGGTYPDEIQRYYNGPSGEILDAFLFTKFDLGDVPVNVKLGQHTIYWGETLFSLADGVSAGQSYADLRKALATPGVEAKEVFKPLNQFSFSAQISPEFTVMGQYFFDYYPDLFPLGGTFFSPVDFLTYQGQTTAVPLCALLPPGAVPCSASIPGVTWDGYHKNGLDETGDWGIAARWRPEWLDGTAGFYYRQYTPKNGGALAVNLGGPIGSPTASYLMLGGVPAQAGLYLDGAAPRTKLIGFSLAKQVWGISWGWDLTYRKDATLLAMPFTFINGDPANGLYPTGLPAPAPAFVPTTAALGQSATNGLTGWAPRGDIWTSTFNMIAYDGKRDVFGLPMYDSAVFIAELDWDGLDKVTANPQSFGGRANCERGNSAFNAAPGIGYYGCTTGSSLGINISIEPKWFQVWPGTDLTMPMYYGVGLKGNSAVPAVGQNEGMGAYSIGVAADVDAMYNFKLSYNGSLYKRHAAQFVPALNGGLGGTRAPKSNAALGDFSDRNWLSFTAKATW